MSSFAAETATMKPFHGAALAAAAALVLTASDAAAFDSRDPADVLAVLSANGASGDIKKDEKGKPYIDAKAGNLSFEVDFYDCNDQGAACGSTLYTTGWNMTSVSVDQINRWNRWTMLCPAYLTKENHPHAWYGLKPSANEARSDVAAQLGAWLDCLSDFDKFTDAPEAFLQTKE
jgi:hypothetical protein